MCLGSAGEFFGLDGSRIEKSVLWENVADNLFGCASRASIRDKKENQKNLGHALAVSHDEVN